MPVAAFYRFTCGLWLLFAVLGSGHTVHADTSPEFYQLLSEINAQLKTFTPTRGPECTADLIDKAQNALQGELFSSALNAVVVKPLETGAKAAASMLGVPAAAITTYSLMRCAMDESTAAGFAQCVGGEAIGYASGAGMGAAGVDEISSTLAGVAWDEAYGRARGAYNSYQSSSEIVEGSKEADCKVRYRAQWFKRRAGSARGGQILLQVWVDDCKCTSASQAEGGYLSVFFNVNYAQAGSNQPGWRVGAFERLHIEAQCCGQSRLAREQVYLFNPQGLLVRDDAPVEASPAPAGGAGAAIDEAVSASDASSESTPPPAPPPIYLPPPEKIEYTFDEPCPACIPIKQAMEAAVQEWVDLRNRRNQKFNDKSAKQEEIGRTSRRISYLESRLRGESGTGGESYDPSSGLTTKSYDTGDGQVRITVEDKNGNVLSERFRQRESTAEIQQELAARRNELEQQQQQLADIETEIEQLAAAIAAVGARIDNLSAALRDCIARLCGGYADCKQLLDHIQDYRNAGLDTGVSRDVVNRLVREAREKGCFDIDQTLQDRVSSRYDLTGTQVYPPSILDELEIGVSLPVITGLPGAQPGASPLTGAQPGTTTLTGVAPTTGTITTPSTGTETSAPSTVTSAGGSVAQPVPEPPANLEVIPASNADLESILNHANGIAASADACLGYECPVLDCGVANTLLLGLINAEANLDQMLKWLNEASDDAMNHLLTLNADGILTGEMLSQAQEAQAVHQWLHNIGSLLLDLASLKGFFDNFKDGSFADGSALKRLDSTYEMLKDLESAVGTVGESYGVSTPAPVSGVPGAAIGAMGGDAIADALGAPNATPENLGSVINDLKSQINDAIDIVENAREGKSPAAAVGKAIGRIVKTISAGKLKERERLMGEYMHNMGAGAQAIAGAMQFLQRVNNRRYAAEDALKAVRAAKEGLMACIARVCGAMSLVRPTVTSGFDGWGSALRYFNAQLPGIAATISQPLEVRNQCPADGPMISIGGGDSSGSLISVGGGALALPKNRVEAACPPCQGIADQIGRIIDEVEYWRSEIARIQEQLRQAEIIRQRIELLEQQKGDNRNGIQEMNKGIAEADVLGINVAPGLRIMLREAEARGRDLQRQITALTRELERMEVDRDRIQEIEQRISSLNETRRELREQLRICEQEKCNLSDQARLLGDIFTSVEVIDVRNITGNDPFDPRDPLAQEASNIGMSQNSGSSSGSGSTGGGSTSGGGSTTGGGGTTGGGTTSGPIMVISNPSLIRDRHIVGSSPCPDDMGTVNVSLASGNPFTITNLQLSSGINSFVVVNAPGIASPSTAQMIGVQFNCASSMTTIRSGSLNGTVTDTVTDETTSLSVTIFNEVTNLISVVPAGGSFIPVTKLFQAGPDACPLSHFHGGPALACNGVMQSDPAPTVCGFGTINDVVQIQELDCANP